MGKMDDLMPVMAMTGLQFIYAGVALFTRKALLEGLSPRVLVVYRQAIATLVMAPIACFPRRKRSSQCSLGVKSFSLMFLASLVGVTLNQNAYFEGLYLASSSSASAMTNLVPAITFLIATIVGLEKVPVCSIRSIAKVGGTLFCVGGAVFMALLKGPKLLNAAEIAGTNSLLGLTGDNWLLGCLFLLTGSSCWSVWLILQVPIRACYPDHLKFTAWMCFFSTLQSAALTLFVERDQDAWTLHSYYELGCCLYTAILGTGLAIFVQSWCISKRGPLFSALFNPLCTVLVTAFASMFLEEEIYAGSLIGALAVIIGLYVVLWGKAGDLKDINKDIDPKAQEASSGMVVKVFIDESPKKISETDVEEPLLPDKSDKLDEN